MKGITPFLWFDNQAEEAAAFYTSVFKESENLGSFRGGDGKVLVATFTLNGLRFMALNGGPEYKFTHATSFMVHCASQAEVDYYWEKLTDGGEPVQCGWLLDKYGLSWQIVPNRFTELMETGTPEQAGAVMSAMMQMIKFDIAALERAFESAKA